MKQANPLKLVLFGMLLFLVTGCMLQPGASIKVEAAKNLNPSINGEPSPLVLTVYQLRNPLSFQHADYRSLMMNSASILGSDLLDKKAFEVRPDSHISISQKLLPATNYLGIVAAYRKPSGGGWHKVIKVDKNGLLAKTIKVDLGAHEISIKQ